MAADFVISGKTTVSSDTSAIGITGADDEIRIEIKLAERVIHTSESGPEMPAKIINLGATARITIPFVKWDASILEPLLARTSSATYGQIGSLGSDVNTFPITITPTIGGKIYTFSNCRAVDSFSLEGFGIRELKFAVVFEAFPDPTALSTASTALFTVTAVS